MNRRLVLRRAAATTVAACLFAALAAAAPQQRTSSTSRAPQKAAPKAPSRTAPRTPAASPPPAPAVAETSPRVAAAEGGPIWVASWGDVPPGLRNVFPMVWIRGNAVGDRSGGSVAQFRPELVAQQLRALPEGRRAILPWRYRNAMVWAPAAGSQVHGHSLDRVQSRDGDRLLEAPSPFLDHAAAAVAAEFGPFIAEVRRLGGTIDFVIADDESPDRLSGWHLDEAKIRLIMEDPRFAERAGADGRTAKDLLGDLAPEQVRDPARRDAMARWNATMSHLAHLRIDEALFGSVKSQFPQVRGSNYAARVVAEENAFPDLNGHLGWGFSTFGTHSAFPAYGRVRQLATHFAPDPSDPTKIVRGRGGIPAEPWSALLVDANAARAIARSSDRPFHAWIADPAWPGDRGVADALYHENHGGEAYHRENLFHQALAGAEMLLYWTPYAPGFGSNAVESPAERQKRHDRVRTLNRTVEELNRRLGFAAASPIATAAVPWTSRALLSGARRSDGSAVWRLSVHPQVESVRLSPSGQRIAFPAGTVGAWVELPDAAPQQIGEVTLRRAAAVKPRNSAPRRHVREGTARD